MVFVGIDPGLKGGIAAVSNDWHIILPMPDRYSLPTLLKDWHSQHKITHVCIEHSQAIFNTSAKSTFSFGEGFGFLQGVVVAMGLPYTLVKPKQWQKDMFVGTAPSKFPKKRALEIARRLLPGERFLATTRSSTPHDGMVDSFLIGEYARRRMSHEYSARIRKRRTK